MLRGSEDEPGDWGTFALYGRTKIEVPAGEDSDAFRRRRHFQNASNIPGCLWAGLRVARQSVDTLCKEEHVAVANGRGARGGVWAAFFGVTTPFRLGLPTIGFAAILSMVLVMLVIMVKTTGNAVAVGAIVDKPIREDNLTAGLRADGLSTALGGIFNALPYTAYAQNVALVGLTGVKSRWVAAAAGGFLILLGLFPKLAAIPLPVLGGAGFALFGTVAATGIHTLSRVDFDRNVNLVVVAVSLAVGLISVALSTFYSAFPSGVQIVLNSGIAAGSLTAIILNVAFNALGGRDERPDPASVATARTSGVTSGPV